MAEEVKVNKETMIGFNKDPITNFYTVEKKLGDGTYGCVYLATHKSTGLKRAIK
jgi:serine/threonine protein kinase